MTAITRGEKSMKLLKLLKLYRSPINIDPKKYAEVLEECWGKPPVDRCCYHYDSYSDYNYCGRKRLKDSEMCFWHSRTQEKYKPDVIKNYFGFSDKLKEVIEKEVANNGSLDGAYLKGANLFGIGWSSSERGVNLSNANLCNADLSEAHLSYGSLRNANLMNANLEFAYLSDVDLFNAYFYGTRLFNVKFRNNDFTTVRCLTKSNFLGWNNYIVPIHKLLEMYPEQSQPIYRKLIKYFANEGNNDDASWAAYRERVLNRKLLYINLKSGFSGILIKYLNRKYNVLQLISLWIFTKIKIFFQLIFSYICSLVFGYGEKPFRVIITSSITISIYALIYSYFNVIKESDFYTSLYFSITTFTTLGYGDLIPQKEFRLLASSEALIGIMLTGLFLFTLSRRSISRN